jgi:uncharacterized protein YgiM (DUF1202 family)
LLVACSQTPTEQELGVSPVATGAQFVWPAAGWIRATDYYWNGVPHRGDGSADIAAPYGLLVGAARGGTVIEAGTSSTNAYYVRIRHESGYETRYAHLTDPPLVKVGDVVDVNQTLGYNGRTGNAAVPHVHFSITRYGQAQKIPEIDFGRWVNKGSFVPGTYTGLSELPAKTVSFSVKVIEDKLPVYSSASASSSVRGTLTVNATWSVTGGNVGFYRISYNGAPGYIPMSGVVPSASKVFGVRTTTSTKALSGPGSGYPVETTFYAGTVLSAFGTKNGYYKVLWKGGDKFVHYVWVPTSAAVTTSHFWMLGTFAPKVYIRSGPGMGYPVVETRTFDAYIPAYIVTDNVRGWYKVGNNRWFPGWQTLRK